eukprot:1098719-Pleurochrysis_carterae.AAC.1
MPTFTTARSPHAAVRIKPSSSAVAAAPAIGPASVAGINSMKPTSLIAFMNAIRLMYSSLPLHHTDRFTVFRPTLRCWPRVPAVVRGTRSMRDACARAPIAVAPFVEAAVEAMLAYA